VIEKGTGALNIVKKAGMLETILVVESSGVVATL